MWKCVDSCYEKVQFQNVTLQEERNLNCYQVDEVVYTLCFWMASGQVTIGRSYRIQMTMNLSVINEATATSRKPASIECNDHRKVTSIFYLRLNLECFHTVLQFLVFWVVYLTGISWTITLDQYLKCVFKINSLIKPILNIFSSVHQLDRAKC